MASTISFSGLSASGLDTSSWVDALVSVKQQTVTSLESQKAEKENLLSIVNNIKSYFSSFQSCLQKLTDSQYGIASMDLFMQNLALSSNANIATATATTEAARQSYDVAVDSLATATKATSGYSQFEVKTADLNTTFGTLGGKNGTITVNSQSFNVTTDDTLGSLVDKFKNVGVDASFDEKKGTFTVGIDLDKIDEGATNLKNALKLKNNNVSGAVSGSIVYANRSTEFSKLGLTAGKITIEGIEHTIAKNGDNYTIQKAGGSAVSMNTLGEFFDYLKSSAVGAEDASVDGKGNITIKGATLDKVEGGSNLMEVLNLIESQKRMVSESGALSYVEVRNADLNTKLSALGVTGDTTLVAGGTNNTISNDKTLGDIQKILKNAGVEMNVDNRGVITIDTKGNEISGTLLDVLNLDPTKGGTTISSSAHQANLKADLNTKLSELGVKDSDKYIAYKSDGTAMTVEMTNLADKSINTLITDLKNVGLDANFDEKTHQIVIKDGYITGTLADVLGMTQSTTSYTENATLNTTLSALGATGDSTLTIDGGSAKTYGKDTTLETVFGDIKDAGGKVTFKDGNVTIEGVTLGGSIPALLGLDATTQGTSVTSGKLTAVTGSSSTGGGNNATVEHDIDLNTKIGDITGTTSSYTLKVDDGTSKTYTKDTTLQELKNQIESAGGKFTINDDNTISIDGVTMSGTLVGVLGFDELETGTRFTTVDSVMISGTSNVATGGTTLGNLGLISGSTSGARAVRRAPANPNKTLSINGGAAKSYGANSSLDDIFADIVAAGGTASIDDEGYINIKGVHLEGTLVDALGLVETDYKTTITSGNLKVTTSTSSTSSSVLYSEQKGNISLNSTVGSIVGDSESYNLVVNGTNNTIGTNTKLSDIRTIIQNAGGTMTVNDDNTISVNGVEISGSLVDKLGFMSNGVHTVVSSNNPIYYTDGKKSADSGSTFEQLGISADKRDFAIYKNDGTLVKASSTTGSASGKTIGDWLKTINDALNSANGTSGSVYATINNGVISISGGYVTGSLPTELGIGTTQTVTGITMEGNSVTYTEYDPLKYIGNIQTGSGTAAGNVTSTGMIGAVVEYTDEAGNVLQANENTKLADILDTSGNKLGSGSFTFNVGSYTKTFDADSTTLGDVRDYVNNLNTDTTYDTNTSASIADGKIAIESNVDITGTLMSALGFAKSDVSSIAYEIKGTGKAHYSSVDSTTYTTSGFTKATETKTGNVTTASLELPSGFATSLNIVDTSDAISLSSVSSESSLVNGKKYSISTKEDLIKLAEFSKSWNYYGSNRSNIVWVLTNDIDMSGVTDFAGVEYLFGTFSGNGHVIKNLTINDNSTYVGLFKTSKGTIQDLGLENANVTRGEDSTTYITSVGVLVGRNEGNIQNCYANNSTVTAGNGVDYAGGLVGFSEGSSKITYSWTNVQVNCASTKAGGFVGAIQGDSSTDNPIVSKCFSVSNLRTDKNAGFCGDLKYYYPKIQDCFSVGINSGVCSSKATYIEYQQANDNSLTKVSSGSLVSLKSKIDALGFDNLNWNVEEKELRVSEADSFEVGMTYHISTVADLQKLSSYSNTRNSSGLNGIDEGVNFVLDNDIDMSSVSNFVGIANFKGNFYGNGHVIKNLKISESSSGGDAGLFKCLSGTVQDLGLENVTITTNNSYGYTPRQMSVGALVGELFNGKIENCYVSGGTISGNATYMGGLVGSSKWNEDTISDCWANVTVNKTSYSKDKIGAVGGLVALSGGSISNSYSLGDVNSAYGYVGGFVGIATGTISNSFSTGNVKVTNSSSRNTTYTGGFAGAFGMTSTMKNDYSLDDDVTVNMSNNYSTGTVTAAKGSVGGFVGTIITSSSGTSASDYTMSNNFSDSGSASKAIGSGSVSGISAVANSEINSGISGLGFSNLTMTKVVSEHTATTSTTIKDLMGKGGSQTLTLTPTAGGEAVTLTFNDTDTIQTVIDKLKAQGIDEADLTDGVFRIKDDKQWTISGALANKLFGGTDDVYTFTGSKVTYTTTGAGTVGSVTGNKVTYTTTGSGTAGSVTGNKVTYETTGTGTVGSVTGDKLTYTVSTADGSIVSNEMLYKKLANNSMSISSNKVTYTGTGTGTGSGSSGLVFNPDILDDPSRWQVVLGNGINGNSTLSEILKKNDYIFEDYEADDLLSKDGIAIDGLTADMTLNQLCEKLGWEYSNHTLTAISNTKTDYSGIIIDALFQGGISINPEDTVTKTYLSSVSGNLSTGKSYWIKSVEDLQKLATYSQNNDTSLLCFVLDNDIDMSGVNFDGISNFQGTFYGQGHTISNLTTSLFNSVSGNARVKDVGLLNSDVTAIGDVKGLLADSVSDGATIMNCYVTGGLFANGCTVVGGLVGKITDNALISCSSANVTISGLSHYHYGGVIGGLVGEASGNAQIRYSHSSGRIEDSSGYVAGGFVGHLKGSVTISNGYTTVDLANRDYGAFAGYICEQVGSSGIEQIGFSGILSNVFATADTQFATRMDFEDSAKIENVIYNSAANTSTSQPALFTNNAIGLTLAQMQDGSTMQGYGFNLENMWNTSNGIPDFTDPTASNSKIAATGSTTMAQLGITDFTINGEALSGINADSTVVDVFTALKNEYGIEASISNGTVTFSATSDNYLEGEIINKFFGSKAVEFSTGLNGNSIKSNKVQYSTTETTYRDVYNQFDILPESTNSTKIFDLYVQSMASPSGKKISSGSITVGSVTFTIDASTTVADLKRFLAREDCYLDSVDGGGGSLYRIVSNNGSSVSVSGDIANSDGLSLIGYLCTKSTTSSEETVNHNIDNNTTIGQIFGDTTSHTIKVGDETVTLQSTDKLSTLVSKLADKGVTAEIKNSALYLTTSNSTVFSGDIISRFFGQDKVIAGGSTYKYVDIELSTKFSDMEYASTPVFEVDGTQIDGLTKDSTIQDLFNKLASKGINASLSNGKITLTSDTEHTLTGTAVEKFFGGAVTVGSSGSTTTHTATGTTKMSELGITDFTVNGSALSGITSSSTVNDVLSKLKSTYGLSEATISDGKITLSSTTDTTLSGNLIKGLMGQDSVSITPTSGGSSTHTATGTTKMSELGITDFKVNGSALSGITSSSTVDDVLSKLKSTYGLSEATISDGKITFKSTTDTTLSGNLIKGLMGQDSVSITPTAGGSSINTATGTTKMSELGITDFTVNGSALSGITSSSTVNDVLSKLKSTYGLSEATISDGKITLSSTTDTTLSGNLIKGLTGQDSVTITPTAGDTTTHTATENTTLGELGLTSFDLKINGTSISGLSADSKISDVFAKLADSNITATMTDGKITLTSNEATTLSGTVAEKLLGSSSVILAGDSTEHTFDMEQISASKALYTSRALTYNSGAQKVSEVTELVAGNKYHIASEADLVKLAEFVNSGADTTGSIFIFDNDIDMSSVANFTSIGNDASHAFKGTIYGNGHVVKNLKIDSTSDYQGLFGYVQQATIQDLGVEDANIKGGAYSGILFGRAENAKLTNLYATGTVSGSSSVGGLVGSLKDSVLEKSYSTATVNASMAVAGGLVGSVVNSTLQTVYATGDVNCAASGVVGIFIGTGGLVGTMQSGGTIKNAFATGSVTTKSGGFNGGLIGLMTNSSSYTIDTVYATGNVTGSGGVNGGLIGTISASSVTITNAIYNKNSVSNGVGNGSPDGITGKNFEQMLMKSVMQNAGFTEDKGWVYKDGATPTFGNMTVSGGGGKVYLDDTITSFTSGSAYYISSLEQLNKLASLVNSGASTAGVSFILENDIDVSAFTTAIGSDTNAFEGTFYGNGHVLTGLKTNLFDNIDGEAVIRDIGLENMNGGYLAASVMGNSTIDNVYSTGSATVSGLVNKLGGSATIKNSYSTATVNSSSASAGGLVAQMEGSATIEKSYFSGRVQVGSYYTAGGLVGSMAGGTIKSSYSTASIASGDVLRGGLVGEVTGSVTIQNSYASGTADGGFIGINSGSVTSTGNVYNSANTIAVGSGSSISGLTAISLADMKSQSKMEALGFTASNGWHYYAGKTPMLQGQDISSGHSANVSLSTKIDSILNSGDGRNVKVTANGTTYEKWFEPTDTVKDVRDWLNTIDGVTATFDETNSTFKVSGTSEDFKIDGDLASALFGGRKTTTKTSATVNTDSNELLVDGSQTKITNNTTVGQLLGKASGNYAIGFYDDNGNLVTKNFGVDTKLSEVLQYLKDNGFEASITNGVFTATKDGNTTTDILGTIGNKLKGETGTVTTTDTGYQTGVLGSSSSVKATASTKLSELGIDSGSILIKDNNNNNLGTIQINNSMTIDDTAQLLANYGFTLTITDGKVTVAGEGINRLADGTSNLVSKMKLDNWTETKDKLKTTSTVAQMGFAKGSILGLVLDSKTYNLTFDANATLQDIIDTLGTYGVTASVDSDGKFTATASGNLVLTNELGAYLTKNSAEGYVKEANGYKSKDPLEFKGDKVKLDYDSKVGDILGTGKDGVLRLTIDNTTVVDLRYRADETMSDIIADLKGYGITATINDGVLTAVSDGHTFRFSGEIGKIISGDTPLYEDISTGYKSKDLSYETTGKATLDNTLKEMGISSGQIHVLSNDGKIVSTLDVDNSYTVAQVKSLLQPFGMDLAIDADGKVTVTSSEGYKLSDGTSNMVSTMKLNSWTTTTEKLTGATTLSQMGFKDGADLNLFLDGAVMNVLSFNADQTLDDISFALSAYGIDASVNADGQFTATSKTHTFIMSGGLGSYLTKGTGGYVNSDTDYKSYKPLTEEHPYITDTSKEIGYKKLMTESSTLDSLGFAQGGSVRIMLDGTTPYSLEFLATDTVQDVIYALSAYGINAEVKDGKFVAESVNNTFTITGNFGSYLVQGGAYNNEVTGYESAPLTYNTTEKLTNDTKLSSLGVTRGAINVIKDGKVADTINITNDTTIGQLFSAIKPYGMSGSIVTDASGNTSIRISADSDIKLADGTSNVVSALGLHDVRQGDFEGHKEYWDDDATSGLITEGMLLSSLDRNGFIAQGSLIFTTGEGDDAVQHIINITADETVGSLLKKFNDSGIKAELDNGIIKLTGGLDKLTFNGGTSGLVNTIGLDIHNIDKYASSSSALTYEGETHYSASNFANANTTLDIVNTTDGIMSVFVDGIKCNVEVKSSDTFAKLFKKIKDTVKAKSGLDIEAGFMTKDGTISTNPTDANNTGIIALSVAEGHELVIGASNDTTNFATIANLNKTGYNTITGSRALYRVNVNSLITQSGLYRDGDITEGTFIIGDAEFTIDSTTTLSSLIDQINKNDKAYANAYWDTLSGTLVIQSTNTGASLINIEAGTSNFTDIMGFTKTKDGVSALVTDSQTLGQNAVVRINGTTVTSATNVITSDISRIKGLTINLKNVSEGETVTITVEQDKESIYNAVSDTLDSYNAMMEALNKELSDRSSLGGESILKLMRNNLKRLMTSSLTGAYVFKNLASVGISTGQASDDISTNVTSLLIDKDKFMDALNTDSDAVQDLLVGTKANPGIFLQANNIVESSIKTDGYFSNMANTLTKSINNIDKKITKTNNDIENYRTKLQSKFHNMELTISGLQSAYANLLGQG